MGMVNKLDPSERLLTGVVLIVLGMVGLVYRVSGYGVVIGDLQSGYIIHGMGYSIVSLIIIAIFMIVILLGVYIIYDTIKKDAV